LGLFLHTALSPAVLGQAGRAAKTSKGPRALGLLELAPNGKARLIPITILIDGKYYDAGAYKAAPVPMALWSETVYEAVRTGVSMGLFTVTGALQKKQGDATQWMAEGKWQTASEVKAKAVKKPVSSVPRGMNDDEGPPVLLRRASGEKDKAPAPPAQPTAPTPAPAAPVGSSGAAPAATPPAPTASASASPASPLPPEQSQDDKAPEDKDRPALKRGKAGAEAAEEVQKKIAVSPPAKAVGTAPALPTATVATPPAASPEGQTANQVQLIPAISDSDGPDPLPYTYNLKPEEEQQFRKKMLAMAADEVRARAAQLVPASSGGGQAIHAPSPHGKTTAAKAVQPSFEDVQLRVFDLSTINEPELVLTATARMPQHPHEKGSSSPDLQSKALQSKDLTYMITLVVREDVNGELHKALANVTDAEHLDVIPRLELIDAVDVDGDGRAELLFRQVSDAGSAFVVYRVIGDHLYPLFQGAPG
jgi:hypothetical protein